MSRQADNYFCDKFEIYGEEYSLVEPDSLDELMKAYEVRDLIQNYIGNLMSNDDTKDSWIDLLQAQNDNIQAYLDNLGEFDNTMLINNVSYLVKKCGMRFGDLESALGLSAGYISRTAKTDSKKRMSINVVWKIARLFEVDLKALLERNLRLPEHGIDLLAQFIKKLKDRTVANEIVWKNEGGYMSQLNPKYVRLGIVSEEDGDVAVYTPHHLDSNCEWVLSSDIYCLENFQKRKDLVVVSYSTESIKGFQAFDFILICNDNGKERWELMFCTAEDAFQGLREKTEELVAILGGFEFQPILTKEHRNLIEAFLKEDD